MIRSAEVMHLVARRAAEAVMVSQIYYPCLTNYHFMVVTNQW
jgi:hypothetical protein